MKKAIILIPEDGLTPSIDSNGVHYMTILQTLHNLTSLLAAKLRDEARLAVGNNPTAQAKYLDMLVERFWTNLHTNGNSLSSNDVINLS